MIAGTGGDVYYAESPSASKYVILVENMNCPESSTNIEQCSLDHYTRNTWCDVKHTVAVKCYSKYQYNCNNSF